MNKKSLWIKGLLVLNLIISAVLIYLYCKGINARYELGIFSGCFWGLIIVFLNIWELFFLLEKGQKKKYRYSLFQILNLIYSVACILAGVTVYVLINTNVLKDSFDVGSVLVLVYVLRAPFSLLREEFDSDN